jgi:hypothetical protein
MEAHLADRCCLDTILPYREKWHPRGSMVRSRFDDGDEIVWNMSYTEYDLQSVFWQVGEKAAR